MDNSVDINSIYGDKIYEMEKVMMDAVSKLDDFRKEETEVLKEDPVEHLAYRIKSDKSMREKCRRRGISENRENALNVLTDAIGLRIVCPFRSDVYLMVKKIKESSDFEIVEEKDYIKHSKENGYRSYHMITRFEGYFIEIQLRTISMDTWAALEHQMKYKKTVNGNQELISSELKRCADSLASTDISMQTLRDLIHSMDDIEE